MKEFVVLNTLWYYINSYNYTMDMGDFNIKNLTEEERKKKARLKTERILVGNILEYYLIHYLSSKNIPIKHDKNNPFSHDTGVDIRIINQNINLFLKGTMTSLIGQIRKPLLEKYLKLGGYLLIAKISRSLIDDMIKLIRTYLKNGGIFPTNKKIVSIEEIELKIGKINIDIKNNIKIYGLLNINDYLDNSIFIGYGKTFPKTNFKQSFLEGSYILKDKVEYKKLDEIIKI